MKIIYTWLNNNNKCTDIKVNREELSFKLLGENIYIIKKENTFEIESYHGTHECSGQFDCIKLIQDLIQENDEIKSFLNQ